MPELTVASTTDTDADVKRAANVPVVEEPEVPAEQEQPEQEQQEEEKPEPKPAKSAFQKRIDKLTRERSEAERRAQAAEERLRELERPAEQEETAEIPQVEEPPKQQGRERPKPEDVDDKGQPKYKTYEDFIEDLADWKVEQRELQRSQAEAQRAWEEQRKEVVSTYNRNVTDFKKDHPDFDRIVNQDIMVPQVALDTAFELGNPGIAYYLGQHPEVCKELRENVTRPGWVAARIGQIDTLTQSAAKPEVEEPSSEFAPRRASSAPPPIKPVGGSSTRSSVPLDEMPYLEYRKLRDQQAKARYRR